MTGGNGTTAGLHVAVIMDGNGRWAVRRGQPRIAGHRAGAQAVRRVVAAARERGITTLTLFAVSSDNLHRPGGELHVILDEVRDYLLELAGEGAGGPRVHVIGRRDRVPPAVVDAVGAAERATAPATGMQLRLAIDYSARDALLRAVRAAAVHTPPDDFTRDTFARLLDPCALSGAPDVDLLIRTGGEQRLSDFLLWECAYAELWFTDVLWPDFGARDLALALEAYARRDRRFGRVRDPVSTRDARAEPARRLA